MTHAATRTPLPQRLTSRGGNPNLVGRELLDAIGSAIAQQPRTLQTRIGPSEMGIPCARRLGYKLAGHPPCNTDTEVAWLPYVGTCVHAGLEEIFTALNTGDDRTHGTERFLLEHKVTTSTVAGDDIDGHCDLYDRVTATVVDWKCVGATQRKKYRAMGPGNQYRAQAHLYGRGWALAGHPVDTVMVVFLPRNEPLAETVIWHEPYDEQIALDAAARVEGIALTVAALGDAAYQLLPTADAYCSRCPWHRRGSDDLTRGCPGFPAGDQQRRSDGVLDLI